jgi:site-specific recombinase XerD
MTTAANNLAGLLEGFFTRRLMKQRQASPHTIASYRDTFRLLLRFAHKRLETRPSALTFEQIDATLIIAFLDELEDKRGVSARSRNLRLSAIRSFFQYAAFEAPNHAAQIQRVLAIPGKRCTRTQVCYLTRPEVDALLAAPDRSTWAGRRDHALLLLAVQTGMRLSEMIGLRREDFRFDTGAHVHVLGKGRKERCTPLAKQTRVVLQAWMRTDLAPEATVVFPSARGGRLSADGVQYLVAKHVTTANQTCPSMARKRVTPHVLRHTLAMEMLQAGIDRSVIAMWLGHESLETTQIYLDADLTLKEQVLAKTTPHDGRPGRYRPDDQLMAFLNAL